MSDATVRLVEILNPDGTIHRRYPFQRKRDAQRRARLLRDQLQAMEASADVIVREVLATVEEAPQ